ncbi:hypothetical protein CONLIGDRAFT_642637 [Coniochaeta ligniaria NRRL 30616]|uniref:Uncharacterized protein n=1 Tax=Coniochaeta ligniaria NRRL 30616 TaxID=1408157 RepID=A0A1J7ISS6_9PEZI|nr:hypothetical protein CONLIGDRAFT_642637 [Coniochaeta ligniaria NRRL 30616]
MKPSLLPLLATLATAAAAAASPEISDDLAFNLGLLPRQTVNNLQVFTGALGGAAADAITQSDDPKAPFEVNGDTFNDFKTAANRACDNQHNACADLANNKTGKFTVGQCDQQSTQCKAAIDTATKTSFNALFSSTAEFDIFCDT